ncbi:class I SAM-dependent methyltransferase [Pontibacter sp. G13]|uniref:class I SAM-dependent methyltransferase n=1 Tax=Pontibacter sp. G13 TaxID=3074898 RepID=UPI00288A75A4|nr:class I SAM-dependent methyltransferase [Pontibacter sp. G13]WNJ18795.1 class I SAM-dependent methyltransferase [Pontibacter sp. G13]
MNTPQSPIDTPENWDAASQGYAQKIAPFMMELFADEFVDQLQVHDGHEAVEVAAGSGALTLTLARNVGQLLVTDFSPNMLKINETRCAQAGIGNASFREMNGQALELADASMDRAACSFGLMLFPDRESGFSELKRVLRPKGRAFVSGWAGPDRFEAFSLFIQSIQRALPNLERPSTPPPIFSLANLNSFKVQMEAAGFKRVEVGYATREVQVAQPEDLWAMLTVGAPPVKMLFNQIGEEGKGEVHDALMEILKERYGNGRITLSNTATYATGNV